MGLVTKYAGTIAKGFSLISGKAACVKGYKIMLFNFYCLFLNRPYLDWFH